MEKSKKIMSKKSYYILSWTWGLPMTLIGLIGISAILLYSLITKKQYRLKRHGWSFYLNIGKNWGGMELGMFFLTDTRDSVSTNGMNVGTVFRTVHGDF
ncbi:MAG: hypothetical protein J6R47_05165 [Acholeplasmatales bacterium]|nr:hypothetical protein [Acholeplasmatales bacterium]